MRETELKPCPFCGGEAEIHTQPLLGDMVISVRCKECRSRVRSVPYDCNYAFYHGERNVYLSKEQATIVVIDIWNRRTDNEQR